MRTMACLFCFFKPLIQIDLYWCSLLTFILLHNIFSTKIHYHFIFNFDITILLQQNCKKCKINISIQWKMLFYVEKLFFIESVNVLTLWGKNLKGWGKLKIAWREWKSVLSADTQSKIVLLIKIKYRPVYLKCWNKPHYF